MGDVNSPQPGDVFTFAAGQVRVDAVENGQVYFVSWRNGQQTGAPKRMTLDVWREACSWHSDDPPQPTMTCPKCKAELPDFDGFGVLAHLGPDGCGYCKHAGRDGGVCNYCGHIEPLGIGPLVTAPGFDDGTSVSPSVEVPDTTSLVGSGGGLRTHNPSTASNTEAREAPETTGPIRSSCDIALQEMAWWEQGRATTPKDEQ